MSQNGYAAWLPTETQELLLRAALKDGDDALAAWRQWKAVVNPTEADAADLQVLPLVAGKLSQLDPGDPELGRLRGIHRWVWIQNQQLLRFGAEVIGDLHRAGIETLVLKGAALSVLNYPDLGARTMEDFDVLVPRGAALDAMAVLRERLEPKEGYARPEERVTVHHSTSFVDRSDTDVDLHWYSLWQSSPDDDFWAAAVPLEIGGARSKALCPADQLLQICAHGACWQPTPMLRWIADAILVVRADPVFDWDRFVAQALKRELTATLADALTYLRSAFAAPVPNEVLDQLRRAPVSVTQRAARHAARRPMTVSGQLRVQWERYRRVKRLDPTAPSPPTFAAHLKTAWGFTTYRAFSVHAARRSLGIRRRGS